MEGEEIGYMSNRHIGSTMASSSSRPDVFPGETQETEVDHLDRRLAVPAGYGGYSPVLQLGRGFVFS